MKKKLIVLGLKNRSAKLNYYLDTINGLLYCNLNCPVQLELSLNILNNFFSSSDFFLSTSESPKFQEFLIYIKTTYFTVGKVHFLGQVSNFHIDLLTEVTPQLTNNPCESLNSVLQNKYNLGHINYATMVSGIHAFFSERRDKYRIFKAGLKIAKRKKRDLDRFVKLQFIARNLRSAISERTTNYTYIFDIFYEAAFKFGRVHEDCDSLYVTNYPSLNPQINSSF